MKPAIVITARLGSTRMPRKVLTPLRGRTAFERVVERVSQAKLPEQIVLATTDLPEDDELVALARDLGIDVFRGDAEDVLARWRDTVQAFDIDLLVACEADDVFGDPEFVDRVIEKHVETGADYITCVGLPFGAVPTGISRAALERACAMKSQTDTEGQGRFFEDPRVASRAEVQGPEPLRHDEARMTLDYPDDARFFEAVIEELEQPGRVFTLQEIVDLLHARPDIVAINSGLQAEYWARFHERYPPVELDG